MKKNELEAIVELKYVHVMLSSKHTETANLAEDL